MAGPPVAADLTKNQKKKRRQKLAKQGKRPTESELSLGEQSQLGHAGGVQGLSLSQVTSSAEQQSSATHLSTVHRLQQPAVLAHWLPVTPGFPALALMQLQEPLAGLQPLQSATPCQTASCSEGTEPGARHPVLGMPNMAPPGSWPAAQPVTSTSATADAHGAESQGSYFLVPVSAAAAPAAAILPAYPALGSAGAAGGAVSSYQLAALVPAAGQATQPVLPGYAAASRPPSAAIRLCRQDLSAAAAAIAVGLQASPANSAATFSQHRQPTATVPARQAPHASFQAASQLETDQRPANCQTLGASEAVADECEAADADEQQPPAKRPRPLYLHGNYHRYYGYRFGSAFDQDPRLQVLDKRWFQGRRCLDIGCNEGVITLGVVRRFGTFSMLGIDIDEALIKKACRGLKAARTEAAAEQDQLRRHHGQAQGVAAPSGTSSQAAAQAARSPAAQRKAAANAVRALGSTWFQCEDFVAGKHDAQSMDSVMCLSVTKWIHLNRGDDGVRRLFRKVHDILTPGGIFVLEPQPWRSYKQTVRKQDMSAAPHSHLDNLHFRPDEFIHYLVQELKFELVRSPKVAESTPGFDRPMYVLKKGAWCGA